MPQITLSKISLIITIFFLLSGIHLPLLANQEQQSFNSLNEIHTGTLVSKQSSANGYQYKALSRLHTDVSMQVNGLLASVTVKQQFKNDSSQWLEAIYVFPLPEKSAVDHMQMQIGDRVIVGEIKEKQAARKTYEKAKRSGKRTSLVEQQRPNMFTTSVANIAPGESILIEIHYMETIQFSHNTFALRFPLTITPRYIPGKAQQPADNSPINTSSQWSQHGWVNNNSQVPDASSITPPQVHAQTMTTIHNPVSIKANINPGIELVQMQSLYHAIDKQTIVTQGEQKQYQLQLNQSQVPADRDFVLNWSASKAEQPQAAVFTENKNGEHYSLLMLLPPAAHHLQSQPREITYIIDTSGSMGGSSIQQAKQALLFAIQQLQAQDLFNIVEFNSSHNTLFNVPVQANQQNKQKALNFIHGLRAGGGTNMFPALQAALLGVSPDGYVPQVVFITDGSVGNETELFKLIHSQLDDSRLFTVGIGSAPNSYFMRKAAEFGRGTFTYIGSIQDVQPKMQELFSQLAHVALTDIQINWPAGITAESFPKQIPDLYLGEPLMLVSKSPTLMSQSAKQAIQIQGNFASQTWQHGLELPTPAQHSSPFGKGIATLWAREKIAWWMDEQIRGAEPALVKKQVTELALQHHLVSKFTSFVAVDKTAQRPLNKDLKSKAHPNAMPHGSQQKAPGKAYKLPQTATPASLLFYLALLLLALPVLAKSLQFIRQKLVQA